MKNRHPDSAQRFNSTRQFFYKLKTYKVTWDGLTLHHFNGAVRAQLGCYVVNDLQKAGIPALISSSALINFQNLVQQRLARVATHEDTDKELLRRDSRSHA